MFDEAVNKEYINTHLKIEEQIEKLRDQLALHNQVSNINWAHVGDVKHILSELKKLNGEDE